jgi:uncharacterized membrane protein
MLAKISATVAVVAAGLWLGGMLALGALAAPVVFGTLPAPLSGDVMTPIFRRFDKVALGCAVVLVLVEVVRAAAKERIARLDVARIVAVVVAAGLVTWQALVLSPRIESLHVQGAVRGSGELGEALDAAHKLVELEARAQLFLLVVVIALHVFGVARPAKATVSG